MRRGLIQNFSSIAVIFQALIADPVFAEVGASAPTVFSLTVRGGVGAAIENRSALFKNQSQDYQGLAQPVAKSMVNLSIQPTSLIGVTVGAGAAFNGFGADAGYLKASNRTIIHEDTTLIGEAGLRQEGADWSLQETVEVGYGTANDYRSINRVPAFDREMHSTTVDASFRSGINLRAERVLANHFLTGLEGSYSWGKVKLVDLDGASAGVDTFTRFVPSIYMGLKL